MAFYPVATLYGLLNMIDFPIDFDAMIFSHMQWRIILDTTKPPVIANSNAPAAATGDITKHYDLNLSAWPCLSESPHGSLREKINWSA